MNIRLRSALRSALLGATCGLLVPPAGLVCAQQPRTGEAAANSAAIVLAQPKFQIPFAIDSRGVRPAKIQLWVSTDAGEHWQLHGTQASDAQFFEFRAAAQGEYLFLVQSVDESGAAYPSQARPLRVVVDTTAPDVELAAEFNVHGQLVVDLSIHDEHLRPDTAELRIRTDRDSDWQEISVADFQQQGSVFQTTTRISLSPCREVALVFRIEDEAGNPGEASYKLQLPRTAGVQPDMTLASTGAEAAVGQAGQYGTLPQVHAGLAATPGATAWEPSRPSTRAVEKAPASRAALASMDSLLDLDPPDRQSQAAQTEELPLPQAYVSTQPRSTQSQSTPPPQDLAPTAQSNNSLPGKPAFVETQAARPARPTEPVPVESRQQAPAEENAPPSRSAASPRDAYQCNSVAFSLDYSVESLGGSSLSDVQLWGTQDAGQTWNLWGADPDRVSPFDVQVGNDGRFGFRMVIVGANGVVSNRPKPGDEADVWIEVDTSLPTAGITRAIYGQGEAEGQLVIDYSCTDNNLITRPATLSFRASPNQPWQTIASSLSASETYLWKPPAEMPDQIYLKVEAVDRAGNIGSYEMERAIDIKGLAPRGRIHAVRPIR